MKLLALFGALASQAQASELLKCQGQMEGKQTFLQFHAIEGKTAEAFLWAEFNDDALSVKCKAVSEGSVFWNCTEKYPAGDSFLRARVELTPHGDWASIYRNVKGQGSDLLATLDCR